MDSFIFRHESSSRRQQLPAANYLSLSIKQTTPLSDSNSSLVSSPPPDSLTIDTAESASATSQISGVFRSDPFSSTSTLPESVGDEDEAETEYVLIDFFKESTENNDKECKIDRESENIVLHNEELHSSARKSIKNSAGGELDRKKKAEPRWTYQVKATFDGFEEPDADGYGWRKYGQKDILGAKYPRIYYKCKNKYSHGCRATKQVQRSDEDPTIFKVTYIGRHAFSHCQINIINNCSSNHKQLSNFLKGLRVQTDDRQLSLS